MLHDEGITRSDKMALQIESIFSRPLMMGRLSHSPPPPKGGLSSSRGRRRTASDEHEQMGQHDIDTFLLSDAFVLLSPALPRKDESNKQILPSTPTIQGISEGDIEYWQLLEGVDLILPIDRFSN